jgi:AP endonuclease-2
VKKIKPGQSKLSSFFSQPTSTPALGRAPSDSSARKPRGPISKYAKSQSPPTLRSTGEVISIADSGRSQRPQDPPVPASDIPTSPIDVAELQRQLEEDHAYALSLAEAEAEFRAVPASQSQGPASGSSQPDRRLSKDAWTKLTTPLVAPRCAVHNEPTKSFRVNKPGPNKGKMFYTCSRCALYLRCILEWIVAVNLRLLTFVLCVSGFPLMMT